MECNIVKDLIPLYIDDCCSEESAGIVKEHLDTCPDCKELYESMSAPSDMAPAAAAPEKLSRLSDWKASVMQSVLLFAAFAIITVGVALEASTPSGFGNGFWAISLVVPATGFLLSLANWYFVRLYKNRRIFSNCSLLATLGITACADIWVLFHYGSSASDIAEFFIWTVTNFFEAIPGLILLGYGIGIPLTAVFCVLSKVLSSRYAKMLGKE